MRELNVFKDEYHDETIYTLELSEKEKDVLFAVLASTGGCPYNSPRKYSQQIYDRLKKFGEDGEGYKYTEMLKDDESSLFFNDFPPVKHEMTLKENLDTIDVKKDIEDLKALFEQVEVIKKRIFGEDNV